MPRDAVLVRLWPLVCPTVCLSVRHIPVLDRNGCRYYKVISNLRHMVFSFLTPRIVAKFQNAAKYT